MIDTKIVDAGFIHDLFQPFGAVLVCARATEYERRLIAPPTLTTGIVPAQADIPKGGSWVALRGGLFSHGALRRFWIMFRHWKSHLFRFGKC